MPKDTRRFIAQEPLFIGRARAFNEGDTVPAGHVDKYGKDNRWRVEEVKAPDPEKPLDKMTNDELRQHATAQGVDLGDAHTKDELLAAIGHPDAT